MIVPGCGGPAGGMPGNLATGAKVSASSRYTSKYSPEQAVNGVISLPDKPAGAWAVRRTDHGHFTLEWERPVEASQIIYWSRVAGARLESFRDYEVYLNDGKKPVAKGALEQRRGPQSISFDKQEVTKIHIRFISAHRDSLNPGAAEIGVYATPVTTEEMPDLQESLTKGELAGKALRRELISGKLGFKDILLVKRFPLNISHVYVYHVDR